MSIYVENLKNATVQKVGISRVLRVLENELHRLLLRPGHLNPIRQTPKKKKNLGVICTCLRQQRAQFSREVRTERLVLSLLKHPLHSSSSLFFFR